MIYSGLGGILRTLAVHSSHVAHGRTHTVHAAGAHAHAARSAGTEATGIARSAHTGWRSARAAARPTLSNRYGRDQCSGSEKGKNPFMPHD
jgi:hypothetical protein